MTENPMEAENEEIVVTLDTSKPLGFRLYQPVESTDGSGSNGISLKVVKVRRKSQAYKKGLKPNDVIVGIDKYSGKLSYLDVMDYFRQRQIDMNDQNLVLKIKRGREDGDSEPALCITSKPVAVHSTSSSPTPASGTNVCCVHGVQSKPGYAKADDKKFAPSVTKRKETQEDKKEESKGSGLFQFFKRTESATASKSEKPAPPPPPAPPNFADRGNQSAKEQQQQSSFTSTASSWISKAFQFTENLTKTKTEEKTKKSDDKSHVVNGVPLAPPPAPYIIKTTPVPIPQSSSSRLDEHLKSQPEPRYPGAWGGSEDSNYTSKSTLFVRTSTGSSVSPPSPQIAPEVTIGQATVQIHVKPSFKSGYDYQTSSSSYTRTSTDADHSRTAIWTPDAAAPVSSEPSYYSRTTPKASPTSQTNTVDESNTIVQKRRRQWPPPSNATGVEVVKDLWHGTTGSVADLDASEAPESRFQSYSETTLRDYGSRPSTLPVADSNDVAVDELAATVTAAALRKSKYGEQLSQQVRMCRNIARALTSPVQSPPKAQRMFTARKNRMEKWVLTSPSSIREEEAASTSEYQPQNVFESVPSTDSFEVIRSTPQNWNLDTYSGDNTSYQNETVPVEHYKKYSRYSYRTTSSYHSAADNENDLHLPKKTRNPMGEVHDYQTLSKEYGDNIATNIASPEKCYELSHALTSDSHAGKGVEMFHRRRQKAEDWVVDDSKMSRSTSRSLPPVAPRRRDVDPNDVIESVLEAAARKEDDMFAPTPTPRSRAVYTPVQSSESHISHTSLTNLVDGVKSPTPPVWGHERLFSPTPYSYSTTPRPYTPMDFGGRRTPLQESYHGDYSSRPELTTSVISITTPSTRIVTNVNQSYTTTTSGNDSKGGYNTLPRSWKSFSNAYKQNYAS